MSDLIRSYRDPTDADEVIAPFWLNTTTHELFQCCNHVWISLTQLYIQNNQPERSKREDLTYREPDFEKMKRENPALYSKYEASQSALRCGALNTQETE